MIDGRWRPYLGAARGRLVDPPGPNAAKGKGAEPRGPAPDAFAGVRLYFENTAWTLAFAVTKTVQVGAVPVQAPDQLTNVLPAGGVAVRVTVVA